MLEARDIAVSYGLHEALNGVSLTVDRGEIVVMLGANGAGKSTLLKALTGICEGSVSGDCFLCGQTVTGLKPDLIVEAGLALVPEGRGIFPDLSVAENLTLGAYPARARAVEKETLARVLELFPKLQDRRSQIAGTMSGGEQQMVAIGRAMMSNPDILLLDEPSLGLSPILCGELFRALHKIKETGMGVLLVEQNARQSLAIADRGYILENGRITGAGKADALANDPAVQRAYLGGAQA
ncbi:MAG: ABC transporter ATP-binding protein [Nisaea sp.]|uniref:ABC transporter ATP-binding protein n=1 Tax=Nisaea sp. TaxID=2024842 RepID=UPI001B0368A3|nr:ABC transporter ATP-binding protein [Nisaea sp.]MBO6562954.1 ABC transporter ATP-binding protein [Nisaea sp.]